MKKNTILLLLIILIKSTIFAQNIDNQNITKLVYDTKIINQLKFIVDSLHLKYKKNPPNKMYTSVPQTKGYTIILRENTPNLYIDDLTRDLKNKMPLEKLRKKYPNVINENLAFVTKQKQQKYGKKMQTYFNIVSWQYSDIKIILEEKDYNKKYNNEAVFKYEKNNNCLLGIFILEDFKTQEIPAEYSNMISYVDYMIDTKIAIPDKEINFKEEDISDNEKLSEFEEKISDASEKYRKKNPLPTDIEVLMEKYKDNDIIPTIEELEVIVEKSNNIQKEREEYWKSQENYVHQVIKNTPEFDKYINGLVNEIIKINKNEYLIEYYLTPYISKKQLLEIKRRRLVYGQCGMDNSPEIHALEIAQLSTETLSWDLFLRSHLNATSYKIIETQQRKTYLSELEAININTNNLLLGTLLHASDLPNGHYNGRSFNIAHFFSEAKNQTEIKNKLLNMIADEKLDIYNRITFYSAFCTYNTYIKDKALQQSNQKLLSEILEKPSNAFFKSIAVIKTN